MLYNVMVGKHQAQVSLTPDGKGGLSGNITHTEYGDGVIQATQTGSVVSGTAQLDGHNAKFTATITGLNIQGSITPTGFLSIMGSTAFSGIQSA